MARLLRASTSSSSAWLIWDSLACQYIPWQLSPKGCAQDTPTTLTGCASVHIRLLLLLLLVHCALPAPAPNPDVDLGLGLLLLLLLLLLWVTRLHASIDHPTPGQSPKRVLLLPRTSN